MTFVPGLDLPIPDVTHINTVYVFTNLIIAIWANIFLFYFGKGVK